jgi:hypothetical protein
MSAPENSTDDWLGLKRRFRKRVHRLGLHISERFNGAFYAESEDRRLLECRILPFYQLSEAHQRIVFVGVDWYTYGYARLFRLKEFVTLDANAKRVRWGASRHIVGLMQDLTEHCAPGSVDAVFANGLVGFGLDCPLEGRKAFAAARTILRPQGHFLLGWNELEGHMPFSATEAALDAGFRPIEFGPLGAHAIACADEPRHRFNFYEA